MAHSQTSAGSGYDGPVADSAIITGDAVVLELRYAKLPSRSLAFAIDLTIELAALALVAFVAAAVVGVVDEVMTYVALFVATIGILVGYPVICETLTRGRTVGKIAVGLRAVRNDGGAIRFRHALVRGLVAVVEVYLFLAISVITSLLSPEGKRLGDYLAGTVVVRERAAPRASRARTFEPWLPPTLAAWASTLDLSGLRPDTAMSVRQFLTRAPELSPESRQRLAASLYVEVSAQVTPPAPVGVPTESYLSAVLAERSRRAGAVAPSTGSVPAAPVPGEITPPPAVAPSAPSAPDRQIPPNGFAAPD